MKSMNACAIFFIYTLYLSSPLYKDYYTKNSYICIFQFAEKMWVNYYEKLPVGYSRDFVTMLQDSRKLGGMQKVSIIDYDELFWVQWLKSERETYRWQEFGNKEQGLP